MKAAVALACLVALGILGWVLAGRPDSPELDASAALDPTRDQGPAVLALALRPDGSAIAVGGQSPRIRQFDASTGALLSVLGAEETWVAGLAFSADGRWLASWGPGGRLHVRDATTGEARFGGAPDAPAGCVDFHPTRNEAIWGTTAGIVRIADLDRLLGIGWLDTTGGADVTALRYTPDGAQIVAGDAAGALTWLDMKNGAVVTRVEAAHAGPVVAIDFARDGAFLLSAGAEGDVATWAIEDPPRRLGTRQVFDRLDGGSVVPGEDLYLAVGSDRSPQLLGFDGTARALAAHPAPPGALAVGRQGQLATGDAEGGVRLWRGEEITLEIPTGDPH